MNKLEYTNLQRINSYLGFLRHTKSYKIKYRLISKLKNTDVRHCNWNYLKKI